MNAELLDVKQVQQKLKVSERTVFNLIKRGDLKGFKAGRSWRFTEADVDTYIQRQREKAEEKTSKDEEKTEEATA